MSFSLFHFFLIWPQKYTNCEYTASISFVGVYISNLCTFAAYCIEKIIERKTMKVSIFEILMLLCFACSWPFSIVKALRTKVVIGKSPIFMSIIVLGYVFGILHKIFYHPDAVVFLYLFNLLIVSFDLFLYFKYIGQNRRDLLSEHK